MRLTRVALAVAASLPVLLVALPGAARAETLTGTFADNQVLAGEGVDQATIARFAPDGEVFVAAQNGAVKVFPNVASKRHTLVVNLGEGGTEEVVNEDDRGLLGMAVDPGYPSKPYVYLLFTYNAPPGLTAPFWKPEPVGAELHPCPTPPGAEVDGCTVSGRLVRITIDQTTHSMVPGSETALIKDDWCQQFTSHSVGDLQFGPEGALYVSAGAGGDWKQADYGQLGGTLPNAQEPVTPENSCGDPVKETPGAGYPGLDQNAPSPATPTEAEGGMLRSQSFRRPTIQPATLDGTIARVDPATGLPLPNNPNISSSDLDRRRIVAYGLRQPFRFVFRPEHEHEVWVGDVGQNTWEEINSAENILAGSTPNFGWPCFEGKEPEPDAYGGFFTKSDLCKSVGTVTEPVYAYNHEAAVVPGDECPKESNVGSAITAIGFQYGGPYPSTYEHALFFGDYARDCMWAMLPNPVTGLPDPSKLQLVFNGNINPSAPLDAGSPVDLEVGPDKNLYYVNRNFGELRRLSDTTFPTAVATADRPTGVGPLTVTFSADESQAPDPNPTYQWEFGDGSSSGEADPPPHMYASPGAYTATLKVTDTNVHFDTTSILITVDRPLQAVASADKTEGVGSLAVNFTGHASTAPDSIATYHWDFGDGTSADTVDASHTYTSPGSYTATLTVADPGHVPGSETVSTATLHVTVEPPPSTVTTTVNREVSPLLPEVSPPAPLVLGGLRLSSARLVPARTRTLRKTVRHHGYTTGTTVSFTLSQAASVKLSFFRRVGKGRTAHWLSVAARGVVSVCKDVSSVGRGGKRHSRKVCRRPTGDHLVIVAHAGANRYVFSGWVGGVALPPGSYQVRLRASTATATTTAGPLSFTIVAPTGSSRH